MKQPVKTLLLTLIAGSTAALTSSAFAGAPGPSMDEAETPDMRPTLSPAEVRNAVSVHMDALAARGIRIDRAAHDGIGLEQATPAAGAEAFTELRLLAPRLETRAP
ncbi:MAG: hypothetical protein WBF53_13695 [Litorimonas sp.]